MSYSGSNGYNAWNACQGSDFLVFASPLTMPGDIILAEALNIPAILVTPFPITATHSYPFLKFADASEGKLASYFNVFTYRLVEFISWQKSRPLMNRFRQEVLQLPPLSRFGARYRRTHPLLPVATPCSQLLQPGSLVTSTRLVTPSASRQLFISGRFNALHALS